MLFLDVSYLRRVLFCFVIGPNYAIHRKRTLPLRYVSRIKIEIRVFLMWKSRKFLQMRLVITISTSKVFSGTKHFAAWHKKTHRFVTRAWKS